MRGCADIEEFCRWPWTEIHWAGGTVDSEEAGMSVYRVTEVIGTSTQSWEDAATAAVNTAGKTLRDLRVAEVVAQDLQIDQSGAITYRTKLQISFKYESES
jgi:flavin-binding protein dodecin